MKKLKVYLSAVTALTVVTLLTSCDWSSGSGDNNFNLSGGASIANVSGFYRGNHSGGKVVDRTSNGSITSMTIQQSGNRIEVSDNQGSRYVGSVGSPLLLVPEGSTTIPDGASVATYQISFSGKDVVAAKDIEFTGVITLVTVTDVNGTTQTRTNTNDTTGTQGTDNGSTTTNTSTVTTTNSIPQQVGVDGVEPGVNESNTTTTTSTTTTTDNNSTTTGSNSTNGTNTSFQLTEASTQFRLRGTWVESGGTVSTVDALASGVQGNITTTADDAP